MDKFDFITSKKLIVKRPFAKPDAYRNCDKFFVHISNDFFEVKFIDYQIYLIANGKQIIHFLHDLSGYPSELQLIFRQCNMADTSVTMDEYQKDWWLVYK